VSRTSGKEELKVTTEEICFARAKRGQETQTSAESNNKVRNNDMIIVIK